MFTQFNPTTTAITIKNLPFVACKVKESMLNYQYASNCEWYGALNKAKSVKDIFDVFQIKFTMENNNFIPAVKDFAPLPNIMGMLKAIAPYMEDGAIYVNDEYNHYYTITFKDGAVSGKKVTSTAQQEAPKKEAPKQEVKKEAPKKSVKKTKKDAPKKEAPKKFEFTAPAAKVETVKRADNTYTVQELVKELLKQMDKGNANKLVTVDADFLFQNEKYA